MATTMAIKDVTGNNERNCYDVTLTLNRGDGPQEFGFSVTPDQINAATEDMVTFAAAELAERKMAGTLPEIG